MVFVPSFQSVCEDSAFAFDKRGARARNKPYAINRICEILRRSFKGGAARPAYADDSICLRLYSAVQPSPAAPRIIKLFSYIAQAAGKKRLNPRGKC